MFFKGTNFIFGGQILHKTNSPEFHETPFGFHTKQSSESQDEHLQPCAGLKTQSCHQRLF